MEPVALPAPEYVRLARCLARTTVGAWPSKDEDHFLDRAFECDTDKVDFYAEMQGFELVGCGNFTAVYSHPDAPGRVFKLNAGSRDRMEEYHRWLMDQDHPNLPRVYHVEAYNGGCVAVSEYLELDGCFSDDEDSFQEVSELIEAAGFPVDDVHEGNVLQRGCVPVLNDPSSGTRYYTF